MRTPQPESAALRHHCGILGIYSLSGAPVAHDIYLGLMNLQHRGQDSTGTAVSDGKNLSVLRGLGLVPQVLDEAAIASLSGFAGIGHVRYPTIGAGGKEDAQPFSMKAGGKEFALAQNGNTANYGRVKKQMEAAGTAFCSTCDAELLITAFCEAYEEKKDPFYAVGELMKKMDGGYSIVMLSSDGDLIAFRDPQAIRPLCWGRNEDLIVFASESVALDIIGCALKGDLAPGEAVVVSKGEIKRKIVAGGQSPRHCMFEYVYFARPDSKMDGKWIYEVRHRLGQMLAKSSPVKADIIVPVPDTARSAASGYSEASGIPVAEGLIKNRYIPRTFIMPNQKKRQEAVRLKLNPVRHVVEGKRIILMDDSIVRGTTMGPIVKLIRDAGAKEIHLRITCPPIIGPCFYGIDIPTYKELIATKKSVEEIRKAIGADSLCYQSVDDLVSALGRKKSELCLGCITEDYPTSFGQEIAKKMKQAGSRDGVRAWEEES